MAVPAETAARPPSAKPGASKPSPQKDAGVVNAAAVESTVAAVSFVTWAELDLTPLIAASSAELPLQFASDAAAPVSSFTFDLSRQLSWHAVPPEPISSIIRPMQPLVNPPATLADRVRTVVMLNLTACYHDQS